MGDVVSMGCLVKMNLFKISIVEWHTNEGRGKLEKRASPRG